ncbi:MAG TPA: HAD family hydrolase [Deltaproteobacteria bacterium]|nr:HAD family hydrolase [Deltaproteobacteria bacterium]
MHLIMFDLDGTLIKSNTLDTRCLLGAIERCMGIKDIDSDWTKYNYVTDAGIVSEIVERELNRQVTDKELKYICKNLIELLQSEAHIDHEKFAPIPGAIETLCILKTIDDCGLAIATGCWKESAFFKLATAGFNVINLPIASSDDSYNREEIMTIAYERAMVFHRVDGFKTVTYVGDGIWDIKASQRLGFNFIGIASNDHKRSLNQAGAVYILNDFSDQASFFAAINEIWDA